jgi:CheY-like chemotaxis protein
MNTPNAKTFRERLLGHSVDDIPINSPIYIYKPKILYVEDSSSLAMIVKELLDANGYECDLAPNAAGGIYRLGLVKYDLVILDYHLGQFTGQDVEDDTIKQGIPTIIFTADMAARTSVRSPIISKNSGPTVLLKMVGILLNKVKQCKTQ